MFFVDFLFGLRVLLVYVIIIICLFWFWDNIVLSLCVLVLVFIINGIVKLVYFSSGVVDNIVFNFLNEFWYLLFYLLLNFVFGCFLLFLESFNKGCVICEKFWINCW